MGKYLFSSYKKKFTGNDIATSPVQSTSEKIETGFDLNRPGVFLPFFLIEYDQHLSKTPGNDIATNYLMPSENVPNS